MEEPDNGFNDVSEGNWRRDATMNSTRLFDGNDVVDAGVDCSYLWTMSDENEYAPVSRYVRVTS